jgi:hypothetical protein
MIEEGAPGRDRKDRILILADLVVLTQLSLSSSLFRKGISGVVKNYDRWGRPRV